MLPASTATVTVSTMMAGPAPVPPEPEVLPGLTASDCERIRARRAEIERELAQMGASREFCRNYFMSACGTCEQTRGCACVRHSSCGPALPAHLMDVDDFAVYLSDMDDNLLKVRGDIDKLKQRYRELTADGFMGSSSEGQSRVKRRKTRLEHKIRHTFGLLNKLKGEEYRLLDEVEPITNAMEWHERCGRLLEEKTRLNRLLKCGAAVPVPVVASDSGIVGAGPGTIVGGEGASV